MFLLLHLTAGLISCTTKEPHDTAHLTAEETGESNNTVDSADSAIDSGLPDGLHGTEPSNALPVPEFTATNHDGSTRTAADLLGHPTVMWFFPAAATPG